MIISHAKITRSNTIYHLSIFREIVPHIVNSLYNHIYGSLNKHATQLGSSKDTSDLKENETLMDNKSS